MKKSIFLALTFLFSFTLMACSSAPQPSTPAETPAEAPATTDVSDHTADESNPAETKSAPQYAISEDRAKEIVFENLRALHKEITNTGALHAPPTEDSSYRLADDLWGEIDTPEHPISDMPDFHMYVDSIDEIGFIKVSANDNDHAWIVDAGVKTNWGEIDSNLNLVWHFQVDCNTGELLDKALAESRSQYENK